MIVARALPFLILLTVAVPAQEETRTATPANERPPAVVVNLSFKGGTLAEFVAALRAAETKANIVVATAAAGAKVPAMDLRGAGIGQALDAACVVAESEYPVRVKDFRGPGETVYSVIASAPTMMVAGPNGPVVGTSTGNVPLAVKAEENTQVFSLNRLTEGDMRYSSGEGMKVETILSAIEAGTSDEATKVVLRYHRDSGLLFLRGTRAQTNMVKELLSNLERDVQERRRRSAPNVPAPNPVAKDAKEAKEAGDAEKVEKKD